MAWRVPKVDRRAGAAIKRDQEYFIGMTID